LNHRTPSISVYGGQEAGSASEGAEEHVQQTQNHTAVDPADSASGWDWIIHEMDCSRHDALAASSDQLETDRQSGLKNTMLGLAALSTRTRAAEGDDGDGALRDTASLHAPSADVQKHVNTTTAGRDTSVGKLQAHFNKQAANLSLMQHFPAKSDACESRDERSANAARESACPGCKGTLFVETVPLAFQTPVNTSESKLAQLLHIDLQAPATTMNSSQISDLSGHTHEGEQKPLPCFSQCTR
jgi:hypothetical protein